jgi:hypothetical protein
MNERMNDYPSSPIAQPPGGAAYTRAVRTMEVVDGETLSERVQNALYKSYGVSALGDVAAEVEAVAGKTMRWKFWQLVTKYLNGVTQDDQLKQLFIQEIKRLEPQRRKPTLDDLSMPSAPSSIATVSPETDNDLSGYLQRHFSLANDVPVPYLDDKRTKTDEQIDAENAEILGHLPSNIKKTGKAKAKA